MVVVVEDRLVLMEAAVIPGMGDTLSGGVIRSIQGLTIMVVEATEAEAIHHTHHARFIPKAFQPAPAHTIIVDQAAAVMVHQVEDSRHLAMEGMFGEHHHHGVVGLQMGMAATQLVPVMAHMEVVGMVTMADLVAHHTLRVARHPVDEGGVGNDTLCLL